MVMSQIGQNALGAAEIPALGALVTFLFQFIKQHPKFDQNKFWHIALIIISIIVGFIVWHDVIKAIEACGLIAMQAMSNYHRLATHAGWAD